MSEETLKVSGTIEIRPLNILTAAIAIEITATSNLQEPILYRKPRRRHPTRGMNTFELLASILLLCA